jgi:PAS domain S-box-containing protein
MDLAIDKAVSFCEIMHDWPDRVYVKDHTLRFRYANTATWSSAGKTSFSELCGQTDAELFKDQHLHDAASDDSLLLTENGPHYVQKYELETWIGGDVKFVCSTKKVLLDDHGRRIGILGITRDLTAVERDDFLTRLAANQKSHAVPSKTMITQTAQGLNLSPDDSNCGYWWEQRAYPRKKSLSRSKQPPVVARLDNVFRDTYPGADSHSRVDYIHDDDRLQVVNAIKCAQFELPGFRQEVDYRVRNSDRNGTVDWIWMRGTAFVIAVDGGGQILVASHRRIEHPNVSDMLGRTLIDRFPGLIFVKDAEGRFRFMNRLLLDKLGATVDEISDTTDSDIAPNERERAAFRSGDETVLATGSPFLNFETLTLKDQPSIELMTIKFPFPADAFDYIQRARTARQFGDQLGNVSPRHVLGISVVIPKVGQDMPLHRDIREERIVFNALFSTYADAIYMKECRDGKFVYVAANEAFCKMVGLSLSSVIGKTVREVWGETNPTLISEMEHQDILVFEDRESETIHNGFRLTIVPDQELPEYRSTQKHLLRDTGGAPWRILGISRNMTDLVRSMKALDPSLRGQIGEMGFKIRDIAVMFCDIRGFSELAAKLSGQPDALLDLYRRFYDLVSELGERHKCVFDKLQGDGAMFVGGVSWHGDTPKAGACRAACFALELIDDFRKLLFVWRKANAKTVVVIPNVRIGVGIHIGSAFAGMLENSTRVEFIAFGDDVNAAQRIESAAGREHGDILVSARVRELIDDQFVIAPLISLPVKGGEIFAASLLDKRE